jgi:hypothetical protein
VAMFSIDRKHSTWVLLLLLFILPDLQKKTVLEVKKGYIHGASTSKILHTPVIDENFPVQQNSALVLGKSCIADSVAIDTHFILMIPSLRQQGSLWAICKCHLLDLLRSILLHLWNLRLREGV